MKARLGARLSTFYAASSHWRRASSRVVAQLRRLFPQCSSNDPWIRWSFRCAAPMPPPLSLTEAAAGGGVVIPSNKGRRRSGGVRACLAHLPAGVCLLVLTSSLPSLSPSPSRTTSLCESLQFNGVILEWSLFVVWVRDVIHVER